MDRCSVDVEGDDRVLGAIFDVVARNRLGSGESCTGPCHHNIVCMIRIRAAEISRAMKEFCRAAGEQTIIRSIPGLVEAVAAEPSLFF